MNLHFQEAADSEHQSDIDGLRPAWLSTFGRPAPSSLGSGLLQQAIAWQQQVACEGDLAPGVCRDLRTIAERARVERFGASKLAAPTLPSVAASDRARLIRAWDGETHTVDVIDGAFIWRDQHFASLTAVARAITGKHWNGPLFFGLRDRNEWPSGRRRGKPRTVEAAIPPALKVAAHG